VVSKSCSPQFFGSRGFSNETKSNMCGIGLCDVSFLANCTFVDRVLGDYYSVDPQLTAKANIGVTPHYHRETLSVVGKLLYGPYEQLCRVVCTTCMDNSGH
jgi:hypothetical protein